MAISNNAVARVPQQHGADYYSLLGIGVDKNPAAISARGWWLPAGESIWRQLQSMPGPSRYRAAAAGDEQNGLIIFAAGTTRPYNFDGIGYDGEAALPLASVVSYDPRSDRRQCHKPLASASMDHRGLLLNADAELIRIGGMQAGQQVSAAWRQEQLPARIRCSDE